MEERIVRLEKRASGRRQERTEGGECPVGRECTWREYLSTTTCTQLIVKHCDDISRCEPHSPCRLWNFMAEQKEYSNKKIRKKKICSATYESMCTLPEADKDERGRLEKSASGGSGGDNYLRPPARI